MDYTRYVGDGAAAAAFHPSTACRCVSDAELSAAFLGNPYCNGAAALPFAVSSAAVFSEGPLCSRLLDAQIS